MSLCRQQAFIDAPPEVVWNLLSDIDRHAEWWPGFVEVECDRLETGCEYRQVVTDPFGKDTAETFSLRGLFAPPPAVGDPGLEPGTSSLSETRSNQLS